MALSDQVTSLHMKPIRCVVADRATREHRRVTSALELCEHIETDIAPRPRPSLRKHAVRSPPLRVATHPFEVDLIVTVGGAGCGRPAHNNWQAAPVRLLNFPLLTFRTPLS